MLDRIAEIDQRIQQQERQLGDLKQQRAQLTQDLVSAHIPYYRVAKATGRSTSTVQRWVKKP